MSGHVVNFTIDGKFAGLHTDRTDLSALGPMKVKRASWVDFNEDTQLWEVRWEKDSDKPVFSNESREVCLCWERQQLQKEDGDEQETMAETDR